MSTLSIHWVKSLGAQHHKYDGAPLQLRIETQYDQCPSEITLYLNNDALVRDLVIAINDVVAKHKPAPQLEAAE